MKIKIIKEYKDTELNRIPKIGEEVEVTDKRAGTLIAKNVAYAVVENADELKEKILELENSVDEKSAKILELEKLIKEKEKAKK